MATEKNLYGRITQKIDTAANWEKAINFIPKKGEIIVYAKDENRPHDRIKIGDGTTIVKELPFIDESLQNQIDTLTEDKMDKTDYLGPVVKTGTFVDYDNGAEGLSIAPTTYFSPIQSGSGDPYPAGSGKNLIPSMSVDTNTSNGVTFTKQSDGSVVVNGTATGYASAASVNIDASALRGKTLTVKGSNVANVVAQIALQCDSGIVYKSATASNSKLLTFVMPNDANTMRWEVYVPANISANNVVVYPQLELGSESTAYEPYSNIRSITGQTEAKLTRCGKNLLNPEPSITSGHNGIVFTPITGGQGVALKGTSTGAWAQNTAQYYNTVLLPPGQYTLSQKRAGETGGATIGVVIQFNGKNSITTANNTYTFTLSEYTKVGWFVYVEQSGVTVDCSVYHQLEKGNVATEYEPYKGETFITQFGQTVYGGELNWNTGVLTADIGYLTLNGNESWGSSGNRFALNLNGYEIGTHYIIADRFKTVGTWEAHVGSTNTIILYRHEDWKNETRISITTNHNNVDEWKAYLAEQHAAGTPVQICYKLATPYTIQLTPKQIDSLQGYNALYGEGNELKVIFNTINQSSSLESLTGIMPIDKGGTGASTAAGAATNLITGAASTITAANLTANKVLISNGSGKVAVSTISKADLETLPSKASKEYVDQKVLGNIPVPTKASVGQTIVVKTVDANGVPTSWEAIDLWVMTAPNGTRFKLTIDNEGVMTATEIV